MRAPRESASIALRATTLAGRWLIGGGDGIASMATGESESGRIRRLASAMSSGEVAVSEAVVTLVSTEMGRRKETCLRAVRAVSCGGSSSAATRAGGSAGCVSSAGFGPTHFLEAVFSFFALLAGLSFLDGLRAALRGGWRLAVKFALTAGMERGSATQTRRPGRRTGDKDERQKYNKERQT